MKFLCWNIDQARREEMHPETCWDSRSSKVKSLIERCNADIISLIELRNLETSKESARAFLSDPLFHKYDVVTRRYCHNKLCFHMALLYDPMRFFLGDVRLHSYLQEPDNDKIVMFIDLQRKDDKSWFTIGVTHLDLPEEIKWASIHVLRQLIAKQPYPCMVYGDYNFFDDRQGQEQREWMLKTCKDLANPLQSALGELKGTFIGFAHDEFKKSLEKPSRLDHIFSPNMVAKGCISPFLDEYKLDNNSYSSYTYPSDHLALLLDI